MSSYILGYLSKGLSYLRLPSYHGSINIKKGLKRTVRIVSDPKGVIHIYSDVEEDAYFAQGFTQGLERYFQLEVIRKASEGTLSEIFPEALFSDELSRTLGFDRAAAEDQVQYPNNGFLISFLNGINTYLETTFKFTKPVEFTLYNIQERPKPWTLRDVYRIARWHCFRMCRPFTYDFFELLLRQVSSPRQAEKFPIKKEDVEWDRVKQVHSQLPLFDNQSCVLMGIGIMASDVHSATSIPSVYFENHVVVKGIGFNIYGASLIGLPYFFIGRSDDLAFSAIPSYSGITSGSQEARRSKTAYKLFVETFDSVNENRFKVDEKWRYLSPREECVSVKGGKDPLLLFVREIEYGDENATVRRVRRRVVVPGLLRSRKNERYRREVSIEPLWLQKASVQPLEGIRLLNKAKTMHVAGKVARDSIHLFALKFCFVDAVGGGFGCFVTGKSDLRKSARDYDRRALFYDGSKQRDLECEESEFFPMCMYLDGSGPNVKSFSVQSAENAWKCREMHIESVLDELPSESRNFEAFSTVLDETKIKLPPEILDVLQFFLAPIQKLTKTVEEEHPKKKGKTRTRKANSEVDSVYNDEMIREAWISALNKVPRKLLVLAIDMILEWDGDLSPSSFRATLAMGFLKAVVERVLMRVLDKDKSGYLEWFQNRKSGNTQKMEDDVMDVLNPSPKFFFSSMVFRECKWMQIVGKNFFSVVKKERFYRECHRKRQIKKDKMELNLTGGEEDFDEQNQGIILLLVESIYTLKRQLKISYGSSFSTVLSGKLDYEKEIEKFSYGNINQLPWSHFVDDSKIGGYNFVAKKFGGFGIFPKYVYEQGSTDKAGKKKGKDGEERFIQNFLSYIPSQGPHQKEVQKQYPVKVEVDSLYCTFRFCVNLRAPESEGLGWSTILPGNSGHVVSQNFFDRQQFDETVDLKMIIFDSILSDARPQLVLSVQKKKLMTDDEFLRRSTMEMDSAQRESTQILKDPEWNNYLLESTCLKKVEKKTRVQEAVKIKTKPVKNDSLSDMPTEEEIEIFEKEEETDDYVVQDFQHEATFTTRSTEPVEEEETHPVGFTTTQTTTTDEPETTEQQPEEESITSFSEQPKTFVFDASKIIEEDVPMTVITPDVIPENDNVEEEEEIISVVEEDTTIPTEKILHKVLQDIEMIDQPIPKEEEEIEESEEDEPKKNEEEPMVPAYERPPTAGKSTIDQVPEIEAEIEEDESQSEEGESESEEEEEYHEDEQPQDQEVEESEEEESESIFDEVSIADEDDNDKDDILTM